jgi:hypothetical protein
LNKKEEIDGLMIVAAIATDKLALKVKLPKSLKVSYTNVIRASQELF